MVRICVWCRWRWILLDYYLTERPQLVWLYNVKSGVVESGTGPLQGTVLSPSLPCLSDFQYMPSTKVFFWASTLTTDWIRNTTPRLCARTGWAASFFWGSLDPESEPVGCKGLTSCSRRLAPSSAANRPHLLRWQRQGHWLTIVDDPDHSLYHQLDKQQCPLLQTTSAAPLSPVETHFRELPLCVCLFHHIFIITTGIKSGHVLRF